MGRLLGLGVVALVLVLPGCDGTSSSAGAQRPPSEPPPEPQTVGIVSETAAGGEVDHRAVSMDDEASRDDFLGQFDRGSLPQKIASEIDTATIPEEYSVWGAVVAIGCDVPIGVDATQAGDGWVFEPQMPSETMQECFAPVTSVALVAVPEPS